MKSIYKNLGGVIKMPSFSNRKLYMHKTSMDGVILPKQFKDFLEPVSTMLGKLVKHDNVCYITIDEKVVKNNTHRRGGIHVDYNWYEDIKGHSKHRPYAGSWDNPFPQWKPVITEKGGMLLCSNYEGCQVYKGDFDGVIKEGGDCSLIDISNLETETMPKEEVYYLNSTGIHESLKIDEKVERTLIRINFHPEYQFFN